MRNQCSWRCCWPVRVRECDWHHLGDERHSIELEAHFACPSLSTNEASWGNSDAGGFRYSHRRAGSMHGDAHLFDRLDVRHWDELRLE